MVQKDKPAKARSNPTTRISVGFPQDVYRTLEDLAAKKKVSVAWIVRDAAEKYVGDHWPLLEQGKGAR